MTERTNETMMITAGRCFQMHSRFPSFNQSSCHVKEFTHLPYLYRDSHPLASTYYSPPNQQQQTSFKSQTPSQLLQPQHHTNTNAPPIQNLPPKSTIHTTSPNKQTTYHVIHTHIPNRAHPRPSRRRQRATVHHDLRQRHRQRRQQRR